MKLHESLSLTSGRQMSWVEFGDPYGYPVFYFHGTPGSGLEASVYDEAAKKHNVRVIAPDRPGIAGSTAHPERTVLDYASDIEELANHVGADEFSVMGWSGGGPHALLVGTVLHDRTHVIGLLAPQGHIPSTSTKIEAKTSFISNSLLRSILRIPRVGPKIIAMSFRLSDMTRKQPRAKNQYLKMAQSLKRGLHPGPEGAATDTRILEGNWGMTLEQVADVLRKCDPPPKIWLWQGGHDSVVNPADIKTMAETLPNSTLIVNSHANHLQMLLDLPNTVMRLMARH